MKLAQASAKPRKSKAAPPAAEALALRPAESRYAQAFQEVMAALQATLAEYVGKVERRLQEAQAQVALELRALESRPTQAQAAPRAPIEGGDAAGAPRISELERKLDSAGQRMAAKLRGGLESERGARV